MKVAKIILAVILATTMVFTLCACGPSGSTADDTITLTVWEDETNIDMLEQLAENFIAEYTKSYPAAPKLKIEFLAQTEGSAVEALVQDAKTGNGADVVAVTHDSIAAGVVSGVIDPVIYEDTLRAVHTEEAVNAFTLDGTVYGYPITAESITLIYDKTQVQDPSVLTSFESIMEAGLKIGMKINNDAYYTASLLSDSSIFVNEQGEFDKNSLDLATEQSIANIVKFYTTYGNQQFLTSGGCVTNIEPDNAVGLIQNKSICGIVTSPFMYSTIVNALGAENVGVVSMPTINGVANPFSGYKGYVVNSYSENPHLAHALAEYLTNESSQEWRFFNKQYLPTIQGAFSGEDVFTNRLEKFDANVQENVNAFRQSLSISRTMPNISALANYWSTMQGVMSNFYQAGQSNTSDSVKSKLEEAVQTILATVG